MKNFGGPPDMGNFDEGEDESSDEEMAEPKISDLSVEKDTATEEKSTE